MKKIRIALSIIGLVIFMFAAGCSNDNAKGQQAGTASNEQSNAADNSDLGGYVTKIDGNTITISKASINSKGNKVAYKKGSEEANKNTATFKVSKNTTITVRSLHDKGMKHTDTAGSIADIKVDSNLDVWGKKAEDTVTATKVIVYINN